MAQYWHNLLASGGGRVEFVFFIHGLPWAATTHQDVIDALDDPGGTAAQRTYRKALFGGGAPVVDATTHHLADDIPIFPILSRDLGSQAIKFEEGKQLTGGDWSVTLFDEPLGYTWTHRDGTLWGLEGLDVVPCSSFDSTICEARLSRDLANDGTTLYFDNDIGGKLVAKIAANFATDTPSFIWVGGEVVACRSDTTDEGGGEYSVSVTGGRGAWKTVVQNHWTEDHESVNMIISDAPVRGVAGRPATLYAIPMDDAGNIVDMTAGPVRFREGMCMPSSVSANGQRKVSVAFQKKWLDAEVKTNYAEAQLRGYLLCRESSTATDQSPHCRIYEYNGANYVSQDIWLCAAGESVFFPTYDDLCAAMADELAGLGANQVYKMDPQLGPVVFDAIIDANRYPFLGGILPEALGWGAVPMANVLTHLKALRKRPWWTTETEMANELEWASHSLSAYDTDENTDPDSGGRIPYHIYGRANYLVQWGWNVDAAAEFTPQTADLMDFPVPEHTADGTRRLYLTTDCDATDFVTGAEVYIGSPEHMISGESAYGKFVVQTTDGTDNYIDVQHNPDYYFDESDDGEGDACIRTFNEGWGPFCYGFNLLWHPGVNVAADLPQTFDPWVIKERLSVTTDNAVKLLRGLLGCTSTYEDIPEKYWFDHIPNRAEDVTQYASPNNNWYDGYNWTQLETLLTETFEDAHYTLWFDDSFNLLEAYHALLNIHGIAETYGYVDAIRGYQIGYRRAGIINASEAMLAGRIIDSNVRVSGGTPTNVTADTWLYNKFDAQFDYDNADQKYKTIVTAEDKSGRALGTDRTHTVKCKLTHFDSVDLEEMREHFGTMLKKMSIAAPEQKVSCNTIALARLAVGREALVTDTTARLPYTWELGLTNQPVLVTRMETYVRDKTAGVNVTYRFAPNYTFGWAPALFIDADVDTMVLVTNVSVTLDSTDPADNNFADPNGGLIDLEYFDCLEYSEATDTVVDRDCSCGDYAIQVFDANATTYDQATPNRNHWTGTIRNVNGETGHFNLYLDNYDDFNDATDKIVIFNTYDNCEDCQQNYLFFADSSGEVGAADNVGGRWV